MTTTLDDLQYLTPEEKAELDAHLLALSANSLVTFQDLKIRTKDKRLVPFVPNEVQTRYLDILTEEYKPLCGFDWRKGIYTLRGIREDVLKARQQGMSTLWLALYFLDTINTPLTESHVYAHDGETTEKLFRVVHRFYENLPPEKKRPKRFSNKREIVFADTESGIFVGMVGGSALGRGGTVNNAHLSERAWNDNYAELEVGLLQAVPEGGNVTRETTANGFNEYYEERERANRGESRFKPRFFGWNLHSEYRVKSDGESAFVPTTAENALAESYGLDTGQILWRREKVKDLKDKFAQEYPISEREAFLSTGNPVFDRDKLEAQEGRVQGVQALLQPSLAYRNSRGEKVHLANLRAVFAKEELKIYEEPQEDCFYLVSADPASGADKKGNLDDCSASVWCFNRFRPLEQVAHLYGRWEPHQFAHLIAELGYLYYEAMVVVLSMNHGHAVNSTLVNEIAYPQNRGNSWGGLYYHDPTDINQKAQEVKPQSREAGWPESPGGGGGKVFAVSAAQELITNEEVLLNSKTTLAQCFQYVHLTGGGMGGETGHDDAVSDFYCAAAVYQLRGHKAKLSQQGRRQERDTWTPPKPSTSGAFGERGR